MKMYAVDVILTNRSFYGCIMRIFFIHKFYNISAMFYRYGFRTLRKLDQKDARYKKDYKKKAE